MILIFLYDSVLAKNIITAALIAFALKLPTYRILKNCIRRNRPYIAIELVHNLITPGDQFSFPSGHTAAAAIMASVLSHSIPVLLPFALIWVVLVGISRVYLGVHYPSGILAGALSGLICGCIGIIAGG